MPSVAFPTLRRLWLSNAPELYERLAGKIRPYVFSDVWEAEIVPARWGDSSGVRGAAYLWAQCQHLKAEVHP